MKLGTPLQNFILGSSNLICSEGWKLVVPWEIAFSLSLKKSYAIYMNNTNQSFILYIDIQMRWILARLSLCSNYRVFLYAPPAFCRNTKKTILPLLKYSNQLIWFRCILYRTNYSQFLLERGIPNTFGKNGIW